MTDISHFEAQAKTALQYAPSLGAVLVVELEGLGVITIDGTAMQNVVSLEDRGDAATRLVLSPERFGELLAGTLDPTMAYMTGKLKVKGKMGYALKLASLLED